MIPISEIQRVISDLDDIAKYHDTKYRDKREANREYHEGIVVGLDKAIDKLKEAISEHEANNPRSTSSSS